MPFQIPFVPEQASTFARDVDALTYWLVGDEHRLHRAHRRS